VRTGEGGPIQVLHAPSQALLTVAAFLGHVPALRVWAGFRPHRTTVRWNVVAIAATLGAMGWATAHAGSLSAVAAAWLAGHLAWGAVLSLRVAFGTAGVFPPRG
jgi:hypothetical protein